MSHNTEIKESVVDTWKGVTMEELKFMRASALIRLEIQKEYLVRKANETLPMSVSSPVGLLSGMAGKMSMLQKVLFVIKGIKLAINFVSLFRKKR